jgi:hypothetical protein
MPDRLPGGLADHRRERHDRRMDLTLSLVMITALALIGGASFLWFKRGARKQAGLMLLLALVMLINVAIWTLPDPSGTAPIDRAGELDR